MRKFLIYVHDFDVKNWWNFIRLFDISNDYNSWLPWFKVSSHQVVFLAMRLTRYVRDWDFFEKNFSFARSFILLKLLLVRGGKIWYGCWTIYNFDLFLAAMSITGNCK